MTGKMKSLSPSSMLRMESVSLQQEKFPSKIPRAKTTSSSASSANSSEQITHQTSSSIINLFHSPTFPDSKQDYRLAFTKDELEIQTKPGSSGGVSPGRAYSHQTYLSLYPGKSGKKRPLRHGIMMADASHLVDNIHKPSSCIPWINDSLPSNDDNFAGSASTVPLRARQTVTTILRQQHVLEKAEKKDREKLDSLMVLTAAHSEVDSNCKEQLKKKEEEIKAAEAKRLLQARLAYEKAIAASRKVADAKQKLAESTRQKEKEWQSILEEQRLMEKERLKAITESLQKVNKESKRAFDEMLKHKQMKAIQVKHETEQLQAEARHKKEEEEIRRQDKIQQIQAAKMALKKTKETLGNPKQFYRSIAIPETQIKLRLQKEEESRKLQETRQKIQAAKQMKSVKLIRAMKKIQSCEVLSKKQRDLEHNQCQSTTDQFSQRPTTFPTKSLPKLTNTASYKEPSVVSALAAKKVEEIDKMMHQLQQLREQNHQKKIAEKTHLTRAASSSNGRPGVKIIGVKQDATPTKQSSNESLKTSHSFYRHRSHYGLAI